MSGSRKRSEPEKLAQPAKQPHCKACGLWRDPNLPLPLGWSVEWSGRSEDDLFVACSNECRRALGIERELPEPAVEDLLL